MNQSWLSEPQGQELEHLIQLFNALGDPSRMKILFLLAPSEACVSEVASKLNMSESAVSHHIMKRKSGLMRFLSLMLAMGTVLASVLPSAGQRVLAVGASSSAAESLVAHYKFDGNFNDTSSDSTGTAEGGTAPTLTSDSIRGQVMKSGSGKSWIRTDNPLHGKETLDGFTVGAWVKANAVDTWNGIWSISSGAGGSGSHGIVVWESDDLVNWSEPWIAEIAPENAGCTWAPEFIYDAMTGEYVVYWSATSIELNENEEITQEYENHAIYYAKTRDFRTFTEPVLYHAGGEDSSGKRIKVIDSTMIEDDGKYYRYTKNESRGVIEIDVADSVLGTFTPIASTALSTTLPSQQGAVEDPIIFKLNEKSADGKTQWCLMVDRFARGQGYYPLITTDLASGDFTLLGDNDFSMPSKYRHGYVMPVTAAEYDALQRAYGNNAPVQGDDHAEYKVRHRGGGGAGCRDRRHPEHQHRHPHRWPEHAADCHRGAGRCHQPECALD